MKANNNTQPPQPPQQSTEVEENSDDEGGNPFDDDEEEDKNQDEDWILNGKQQELRELFEASNPVLKNSRMVLKGNDVRVILLETGVSKNDLKKIWNLSDLDKDGCLDLQEFTIAMRLIDDVKSNQSVPSSLPSEFIPRSKTKK